jgi:hypothetical protein
LEFSANHDAEALSSDGLNQEQTDELPQSQRLLRYAEEHAELFHNPEGLAYATVEVEGTRKLTR